MKELFSLVQDTLTFIKEETDVFPFSVALLCFQEKERLFLESIRNAISTHLSPASLHFISNEASLLKFFENKKLKLVLFSLSDILPFISFETFRKNASVHSVYEFESITTLPMASMDEYTKDPHLKRFLWNTLKSLPQLSQNLPSTKH